MKYSYSSKFSVDLALFLCVQGSAVEPWHSDLTGHSLEHIVDTRKQISTHHVVGHVALFDFSGSVDGYGDSGEIKQTKLTVELLQKIPDNPSPPPLPSKGDSQSSALSAPEFMVFPHSTHCVCG